MTEFVTSTRVGDADVVEVAGEVDVASAPELLAQAQKCLKSPVGGLVVDLAGVTFIDSSGLGALVQMRNAAVAGGKDFRLASVPAPVRRLLDITGLAEVLPSRSLR